MTLSVNIQPTRGGVAPCRGRGRPHTDRLEHALQRAAEANSVGRLETNLDRIERMTDCG